MSNLTGGFPVNCTDYMIDEPLAGCFPARMIFIATSNPELLGLTHNEQFVPFYLDTRERATL